MPQIQQATWHRFAEGLLLLLAAGMFLLHFSHLGADFPNYSPWMDWAKYTDEGWYGDAAIRYYMRGTWHLPGDFNPGAALPVWPLLEATVFRFTGVGIVAARALAVVVFGGILSCAFLLLRLPIALTDSRTPATIFACAGVVLLAASSFLYAFSRMAILEPLLVLLVSVALLTAYSIRDCGTARLRVFRLVLLGLLIALMIGTKTTAVFLLPAICYMLWDSAHWVPRVMLRDSMAVTAAAVLPAAIYLLALFRGGFLQDVRYLFTANAYTAITRETFWAVVWDALKDGKWIGLWLYPAALLALFAASFRRSTWRDPLFPALVLWAAGYLAYIAYHANLQPRYYLVVAVALVLLLVRSIAHLGAWNQKFIVAIAPFLAILLLLEAKQTFWYVRHPEYTFQTAANHIERIVESEPAHSHTVLSISGSNLSLMTGLPSICDDFGTMDLEDRIAVYKPGWFVTWNFVEDDKMEVLTHFYRLTRIASFPAMDDPDRNLMIVYRLDLKEGVAPKRRGSSVRFPSAKLHGA